MSDVKRYMDPDYDALKERLALSETDRGSLFARLCETEARLVEQERLLDAIAWRETEIAQLKARLVAVDRLLRSGRRLYIVDTSVLGTEWRRQVDELIGPIDAARATDSGSAVP